MRCSRSDSTGGAWSRGPPLTEHQGNGTSFILLFLSLATSSSSYPITPSPWPWVHHEAPAKWLATFSSSSHSFLHKCSFHLVTAALHSWHAPSSASPACVSRCWVHCDPPMVDFSAETSRNPHPSPCLALNTSANASLSMPLAVSIRTPMEQ